MIFQLICQGQLILNLAMNYFIFIHYLVRLFLLEHDEALKNPI